MTSEKGYETGGDYKEMVTLLKDIGATVKAIDSKVEEILDDLKDHFEDTRQGSENSWSYHDLYDDERGY